MAVLPSLWVAVLPSLRALLLTQGCAGCCLLWGPSLPAPGVSFD